MNPMSIMKMMNLKKQFETNHPKFAAFFQNVMGRKIEVGTVIEISVCRPGEEPVRTNMRVTESDLELIEQLKELGQ
ncbi:hypothetical protein [Hominifimenecus sp. rT4P-3]|uniref:hypothetical protein n=1 Tax=Hominifimenecus sp. rT4P-3 TaxID=3242979 RepID=UPI003DA5F22D